MPATTPSGWRSVQLSMPVETWSVKSPLSSCGMPQANSTMSMPRVTSPCASVNTLPCSAVIIAASVSLCWFSSSQEVVHHARAADRRRVGPGREGGLARRPRRRPLRRCWPAPPGRATAPVAGLNTGCERALPPAFRWPLMKWGIFAVLMIEVSSESAKCRQIKATIPMISPEQRHKFGKYDDPSPSPRPCAPSWPWRARAMSRGRRSALNKMSLCPASNGHSQPCISSDILAQSTGLVLFNRAPQALARDPTARRGAARQALEVAWR